MRSTILIIFVLLLCVAIAAEATIFVKPTGNNLNNGTSWATAKKTIQAGINAAALVMGGDEVWVAAGTYRENIVMKSGVDVYGGFDGSEAALEDRDPEVNITVINGSKRTNTVKAANLISAVIIDGFTIQNGKAQYGGNIFCFNSEMQISQNIIEKGYAYWEGGGIFAVGSTVTIEDCEILENTAAFEGGGIEVEDCEATITDNEIEYNKAPRGAGLSFEDESKGLVQFNEITENDAGTQGNGGGMFIGAGVDVEVFDNVIAENTARNAGGVYFYFCDATFASNLVAYNEAYRYGGGYVVIGPNDPWIICDTIVYNDATYGGGMMIMYDTTVDIVNSILAYNTAFLGGAVFLSTWNLPNPAFSYCNFFNNGTSQFYPATLDPIGSDNNLGTDPLFVDPDPDPNLADFHLDTGSPCINSGNNAVIGVDWVDLEDNPRIINDTVDRGCYETPEE